MKTNMSEVVFNFKQKYYLAALVRNDFNVSKMAKEIGANRGDVYKHVGYSREEMVQKAIELEFYNFDAIEKMEEFKQLINQRLSIQNAINSFFTEVEPVIQALANNMNRNPNNGGKDM